MARKVTTNLNGIRAISGIALIVCAAGMAQSNQVAFPGAEGYGAAAVGWKGGEILTVTNLNDAGPGSLRACADNREGTPRVCTFAVSGTIDLEGPVFVRSNTYVAGQTAPGDGIQLRIVDGKAGPLIIKNAHDVVVRFLKVRPGPSKESSSTVDAITIENGERVYLGNLSLAFATDETLAVHVANSTASDITIADNILALSLDRANHPKGRHSKGALICSEEGKTNACGRITMARNLFAHHRDRMPDIKATDLGPVDIVNNVFFNPISQFGEFYDHLGNAEIAYIGNVAQPGPSTKDNRPEAVQAFERIDSARIRIWEEDNLAEAIGRCPLRNMTILDPVAETVRVAPDSWDLSIAPMPAEDTRTHVLAHAGDQIAGRRAPDLLDRRVLDDVMACTGQVIDAVEQVGGWPDMTAIITPPETTDRDSDGLPDQWEATRASLSADTANDPWATDPQSGLSYVETWLAEMAGDPL